MVRAGAVGGACPDARARGRAAADALVRAHGGLVWRVLDRIGMRSDDELIQEGRLALWDAAQRFDPARSRWSTYAMRLVWQRVAKARKRRELARTDADALPHEATLPGRDVMEAADALAGLSAEHRQVLELTYGGPKRRGLDAVAAQMAMGPAACRALHRDALDALRALANPNEGG